MLPKAAVEALKSVGLEMAAAGPAGAAAGGTPAAHAGSGSEDGDQAQAAEGGLVEEQLAEAAAEGEDSAEAEALAVKPEHLPDLWAQELEAWSMLLDGSALNEHMEVSTC